MKIYLKTFFLFAFATGFAAMTKYYGMPAWIENNTWVAMPLLMVGAVGMVFFYGEVD